MFRFIFSFFLIVGLVGVILLIFFRRVCYFKKRIERNKQTFLNDEEEIRRLSGRIETDGVAIGELREENRRMLEYVNQMNIDRCKKDPFLKKLYDKSYMLSAFSELEWKEFMCAFESIYPHFTAELQKQYPAMSTRDIHICILSVMNVKTARIADIMNLQSDTLSSYKQKIKKDCFGITEKKTLESFLLKYIVK